MSHKTFLRRIILMVTLVASLSFLHSKDPQLPEYFVISLKIIAGF